MLQRSIAVAGLIGAILVSLPAVARADLWEVGVDKDGCYTASKNNHDFSRSYSKEIWIYQCEKPGGVVTTSVSITVRRYNEVAIERMVIETRGDAVQVKSWTKTAYYDTGDGFRYSRVNPEEWVGELIEFLFVSDSGEAATGPDRVKEIKKLYLSKSVQDALHKMRPNQR